MLGFSKYALLSVVLVILPYYGSLAQTTAAFPYKTCSSPNYIGDFACNNNLKTCCAVSGTCCAGGCCGATAVCVFQGTSKEACCPISNPSACGARPVASTTAPVAGACPSVVCVNSNDDWYCRYGQSCNLYCPHPPCCIGAERSCGAAASSQSTSNVVATKVTTPTTIQTTSAVIVSSSGGAVTTPTTIRTTSAVIVSSSGGADTTPTTIQTTSAVIVSSSGGAVTTTQGSQVSASTPVTSAAISPSGVVNSATTAAATTTTRTGEGGRNHPSLWLGIGVWVISFWNAILLL